MKRAVLFIALLVQWTTLWLCVAQADNVKPHKNRTANAAACVYDNKPVSAVGRYLVGHRKLRGSVYAHCNDNQLVCYLDNGWSDQPKSKAIVIDCNEVPKTRAKFQHERRLGVLVNKVARTWPGGVACYRFGSTFYQNEVDLFQTAFDEYKAKTPIRFVEINMCRSTYVNEEAEDSCEAIVGFAPAQEMKLNVGPKCAQLEVYLHELGHVLGLQHEHIHPQREVIILTDKIAFSPNEYIRDTSDPVTSYNRQSIMQYNDGSMCVPKDLANIASFCDTNRQTPECIVPTDDHCDHSQDRSFGTSLHLSDGDIDTINKLYGAAADDVLQNPDYLSATQAVTSNDAPNALPVTVVPATEETTVEATEDGTEETAEETTVEATEETTEEVAEETTEEATEEATEAFIEALTEPPTPDPTESPLPMTQTEGNAICTEQVSTGDREAGIEIVWDPSCAQGGIGCFGGVCRFCRAADSDKSAAFMPCSSLGITE